MESEQPVCKAEKPEPIRCGKLGSLHQYGEPQRVLVTRLFALMLRAKAMKRTYGAIVDGMVRRSSDVNRGDLTGIERVGLVVFDAEAMTTNPSGVRTPVVVKKPGNAGGAKGG